MERRTHFAGAVLLVLTLVIPALRSQATTAGIKDVNAAFQEATEASSQLRQSADRLHAIARNGQTLTFRAFHQPSPDSPAGCAAPCRPVRSVHFGGGGR